MDHCRLAGITCMALVSDKEGNYVKVNTPVITVLFTIQSRNSLTASALQELWEGCVLRHMSHFIPCPQVKSFEKDRQSEKRIPETDLADHIIQKCRTKFYEERNR